MGRALSSFCMALCGIIGVLILFNVSTSAIGLLLHPGAHGDLLVTVFVHAAGALVAAAFLAGAFALRRRLNRLDAKILAAEEKGNSAEISK